MDWIFEIVLFAVICRLVWLYWTWDFNVSDIETDTEPLDRHDLLVEAEKAKRREMWRKQGCRFRGNKAYWLGDVVANNKEAKQ